MKMMIMLLTALMVSSWVNAESQLRELAEGFKNPGNEARPRAYWNWLNGSVTLDGLTRDLEEAKDKGLGGLEPCSAPSG